MAIQALEISMEEQIMLMEHSTPDRVISLTFGAGCVALDAVESNQWAVALVQKHREDPPQQE